MFKKLFPTLVAATLAVLTVRHCHAAEKKEVKPPGATPAKAEAAGEWKPLFDGKSLKGWEITDFAGHGEVELDAKFKGGPAIVMQSGAALTGVHFTNAVPKLDYELELEAMKLDGNDFFCGLTFPVGDSHATFIAGGWGGSVVGISSIDSMDASENETTKYRKFDPNHWYKIRLRVTSDTLLAWIDGEEFVNVNTAGRKVSMRLGEIESSRPLGVATYQTKAALRNIQWRELRKR